MSRTLVIGEPGGTHEGQFDLLQRLIDVAADCNCDVIKPQWTSSAERMCARRQAPDYLADYRKLQYPLHWHAELRDHAHRRGLKYGCSIYIPGDAALVAPFVDYLKISSFEAEDMALVRETWHAVSTTPQSGLIVSLGMNASSISIRRIVGPTRLLHCVSAYPAPIETLNLRAIADNDLDGFSDHSRDVRVGAWAVCAGAEIIETHYRLDDTDPANKDYAVSFTPAELKEYIANIRAAELALGDGWKAIHDCEKPMLRYRVQP